MRLAIGLLTLLTGCGQEYLLSELQDPLAPAPGGGRGGRREHAPVASDTPATGPEDLAPRAVSGRPRAPRTVDVELGGSTANPITDYLFVVDGSSSMKAVIDGVFDGVDAIAAEGNVFPADARIAVMSTTPSNPADPRRPHAATPNAAWVRLDPGFHGLVDAERIARFRSLAPPELAAEFALDGCEPWFAPGQANPDGVPCLVAHTQTLLTPVMVEAGLTALAQRLSEDEPLFRNGAAVNVVFVSDTHDPGLKETSRHYDELVALRPSFAALSALADARHNLASFRVHAIAPASDCSVEQWTEPAYFEAAEAGGGETLDICTATPEDYVAMIRGMVRAGAVPQRGVVPLAERAEVAEVLVDGVPVGARLSRDRRAVVLDELPSQRSRVTVRYRSAR